MGSFRRFVLVFLTVVIGLPALYFGFGFVWLTSIVPWQNDRHKAAAIAWNREYAETGHALEITVELGEDSETFLCTAKAVYGAGGLKNQPVAMHLRVFSSGPDSLSTPIGDGLVLLADIRPACRAAFRSVDDRFGTAFGTNVFSSHIVSEQPPFSCILGQRTSTSTLTLDTPEISRIETIPAKSVIDLATLDVVSQYDPVNGQDYDGSLRFANRHSWINGCWRKTIKFGCNSEVTAICGVPR